MGNHHSCNIYCLIVLMLSLSCLGGSSIVGTAGERPLVTQSINFASDPQAALRRLIGVTPDYLVYEMLWVPQEAIDRLRYNPMLAAYPDLTQIS